MFDKRKDSNQDGPKAHFEAGLSDLSANRAPQGSGRTAVIGSKIKINGDISGDEDLVIEGTVEGKIDLGANRVDVGPAGQVHADIMANIVKIDGEVRGDIVGKEKVIIARSGNVQGNIVAPRMTLEDGAKFKGSIDMNPSEPVAKKAEPAPRAEDKPTTKSGNGQGHLPEKAKAEPGLSLEGK